MQIRKQWKKGIALLLAVVFTMPLSAGCGTQYASDQPWGKPMPIGIRRRPTWNWPASLSTGTRDC